MSSKNVPEGASSSRPGQRAWSLAAQLTAWYAGSTFALIFTATGFLYWASVRNIDRDDDQVLGDRVRAIRTVMVKRPGDTSALRQEVDEEWEAHERTRVHLRILNQEDKSVIETPGMTSVLPSASFPAPAAEPGTGTDIDLIAPLSSKAEESGTSVKRKSHRVLAVRAAEISPYVIQVAMDRSEKIKFRTEYRQNLFIVLAVSLLACILVGYQIAHRGIGPIHNITETTRRIRPMNLGERLTPGGLPAELLTLADTFNQMLDRLEQSFNRLSQFSADIAHELRTPVNNLRGSIEVAVTKNRKADEYKEVLVSNLEECERLGRIIDSLLFLARAENPRCQVPKETLDIAEELKTVGEFFEAATSENGVKLVIAVESDICADLNRPLFQRAVCNLVANAVAHTSQGGSITLAASSNEVATTVEVTDTGCGIAATDLPHVFDRFYRADQARSSGTGHVGLGLAIAKSIVELHGGTVQVTSEVGSGSRFAMTFPRTMTKA